MANSLNQKYKKKIEAKDNVISCLKKNLEERDNFKALLMKIVNTCIGSMLD